MDRHPSDRILSEWDELARDARRPAEAPRRAVVRGSFGLGSLVPLIAAALVVAVGIGWLAGRENLPVVGASPSPPPASTPGASQIAVDPSPTPAPSAACDLALKITSWEGAAGSRIADIAATNRGTADCRIATTERALLIDANERVLAQAGAKMVEVQIAPGETVHASASVSNVCGDPPVAPVTIRLAFGEGGSIDAEPLNPTDATVPPCNGPGQPSSMSIQGWTR